MPTQEEMRAAWAEQGLTPEDVAAWQQTGDPGTFSQGLQPWQLNLRRVGAAAGGGGDLDPAGGGGGDVYAAPFNPLAMLGVGLVGAGGGFGVQTVRKKPTKSKVLGAGIGFVAGSALYGLFRLIAG